MGHLNCLKSTTTGCQHQVLQDPSHKEKPWPPCPGHALIAPMTSRPEPAAATAALQHPYPPHTRRAPSPLPKTSPPGGILAPGKGTQGQGREAAVNPPRAAAPTSTGPHAASHLGSFPHPGTGRRRPPPLPRPTRR